MGTAGSGRGFSLFCVLSLFVAMPLGFFGGCIYRLLQGLKGKADGAIVATTATFIFPGGRATYDLPTRLPSPSTKRKAFDLRLWKRC